MPDIRAFLERFRPAGAPGAAAAAVPADRRTTLAAELEPVFALLDDAEEECRRLLDEAEARAQSIRRAAGDEAAALVEQAHADAAAERATAAATVRKAAEEEREALAAAAEEEARRIDAVAGERLPDLVARALRSVDPGGRPGERA